MLSSPRKPPSNTLLPLLSLRLTHQVKFISSLCSTRWRNWKSPDPSISKTFSAAQACTGGFTSSNAHSYAGSCPLGCMYHSCNSSRSWPLAYPGSTCAIATQWNARSQAAYHGYSQVSGMEITSQLVMCFQCALRPCRWLSGGGAEFGSPDSQRATSYW